ncbi:helix-turn-helix domain-containing protein [Paenibacillus taiwanensis]|uniref:helix-turn-helix domain-containing protein n=1 Tax=Paenibacillus taiwanensis TaxID=401638 RepID=UPI001FDF4E92|nr:helix-turn-helix transcriptional regulator [Paenibacillus taiwanensis]
MIPLFGRRLAELRGMKGITQQELADRLHLSRAQVSNYEQGSREPDFATLVLFADFFEVSVDDMLGRKFPPSPGTYIQLDPRLRNSAFFGIHKEELSDDEADFLKGTLKVYREVKLKHGDKSSTTSTS